jgi:rfaE bifunctional protein nucleotidyltransferase chain/domain
MRHVKTIKRKKLKSCINCYRKQNKKIVFTNGCFDILHPGHIKIFRQAKKQGDILVVGANSDKSIKKIKGSKRPILSQGQRAAILSAIEYIDYLVFFDEPTPYNLIKTIKPDVLVKGGDWDINSIVGADLAKEVQRVKLLGKISTTKIIEKILKRYG